MNVQNLHAGASTGIDRYPQLYCVHYIHGCQA